MSLKPYHHVWLEAHPHRSPEWLAERLRDGFDIHHVDGDHANNEPWNLVLIEHTDHMRLHNKPGELGRLTSVCRERTAVRREKAGELAYALLAQGSGWREVSEQVGYSGGYCYNHAKAHAERNSLPWPL